MLAEFRGHARLNLRLAADPEWRIHRLQIAVGERNEKIVLKRLRIVRHVGHRGHDLEQYAARIEPRAPFAAIAPREGRVQFADQRARIGEAIGLGREPRIVCKIRPFETGDKLRPQTTASPRRPRLHQLRWTGRAENARRSSRSSASSR